MSPYDQVVSGAGAGRRRLDEMAGCHVGERLESARQENGRIAAALSDTRAAIDTLQAAAGRLVQEEEKLRGRIRRRAPAALTRRQKIQRLLNGKSAVRDWFNTALPADVARLHQRQLHRRRGLSFGCPKVSAPIPASRPATNGDLSADIRQLENALAACAVQVDDKKHCQEQHDVKNRNSSALS